MSADFTPSMKPYKETGSFKFWCQKVLPQVYDDSLSYYETLCKVVNYLNSVIENVDNLNDNVLALRDAFVELQGYVNTYFENLDVQEEINNKLDVMATDGTLSALVSPFVTEQVTVQIGDTVAGQIGDTVASQISGTVAGQIGDTVANQLPSAIGTQVTDWLTAHVTPVSEPVVIDDTLTIQGACADAKAAGDAINNVKGAIIPISTNKLNVDEFVDGYYSSGVWTPSTSYGTSPFIECENEDSIIIHRFVKATGVMSDTERYFQYIYWFNSANTYLDRTPITAEQTSVDVPSNAVFCRAMKSNSEFDEDTYDYYIGFLDIDRYVPYNYSIPDLTESVLDSVNKNQLNPFEYDMGYYSLSGGSPVWVEDENYMTFPFNPTMNKSHLYWHRFDSDMVIDDTSRTYNYAYWFDSSKNYLSRTLLTSEMTSVEIPNNAVYYRVMAQKSDFNARNYNYYVGFANLTYFVPCKANCNNLIKLQSDTNEISFSLVNNIYTINNGAEYTFKLVTDNTKNLNTYRLYKMMVNGNKVFEAVDGEGVVKINGETDFIGGYHGSEQMTAIRVFRDGTEITNLTEVNLSSCKNLTFYVDSDVYHCYQDSAVASIVAFKKHKMLMFEQGKLTIANDYTAQDNFNMIGARLALLSVDKVTAFTSYSVNSDYHVYNVADFSTSHPVASTAMTEAIINYTGKIIRFKSLENSDQNYCGTIQDFTTRLKFYFDTMKYNEVVPVVSGEKILSKFTIEVL